MAKRTLSEWSTIAVNLIVIVAAVGFVAHPNGFVRREFVQWRESVRASQTISEQWPAISGGARTDTLTADLPVIVKFSDYTCYACKQAHFEVGLLAREAGVAIVLRHAPSSQRPFAEQAARAAVCAEVQGRFPQMNHVLFTVEWTDTPDWLNMAKEAGVSGLQQFQHCLTDESTTSRIVQDLAHARQLGVPGTPTFIGPKGVFAGIPDRATIEKLAIRK